MVLILRDYSLLGKHDTHIEKGDSLPVAGSTGSNGSGRSGEAPGPESERLAEGSSGLHTWARVSLEIRKDFCNGRWQGCVEGTPLPEHIVKKYYSIHA